MPQQEKENHQLSLQWKGMDNDTDPEWFERWCPLKKKKWHLDKELLVNNVEGSPTSRPPSPIFKYHF